MGMAVDDIGSPQRVRLCCQCWHIDVKPVRLRRLVGLALGPHFRREGETLCKGLT